MLSSSLTVLAICAVAFASPHIERRWAIHERRDAVPESFARVGPAEGSSVLNMRLALTMSDRDGLEAALNAAADPKSSTFRQWLSKEQVESFSRPAPETSEAVNEWLASYGVTPTQATIAGDWLSFVVPVSTASKMFNAEFSVFEHVPSGQQTIRTLELSLPANLNSAIQAVYPATSFSGPLRAPPMLKVEASKREPEPERESVDKRATVPSSCTTKITPACLQALYNIPTTPATQKSSVLGVTGMDDQFANQADLKDWLSRFRTDIPSNTTFGLTSVDGGVNTQTRSDAGVEASLDIQYTVGLATNVPVTFVSVGTNTKDGQDDGFLDIITALINESAPPTVLTTSYGFDTEASLSFSLTNAMCNSYMQLTARGTSILFASGDGGVASTPGVSCTSKKFPPTFPTCPFATLVGATESVPETAASLSAGGFSNYFAQQSWQAAAVNAYISSIGTLFSGAYNKTGRAYPDVSAQGNDVQVEIDGSVDSVAGTSCSSPIFSSVIALINDELVANGKPVLGFLNPWLYANPQAFNDITTGSNPGCGTNGFPAKVGWDPVTGLGSPNYVALRTAAGLS